MDSTSDTELARERAELITLEALNWFSRLQDPTMSEADHQRLSEWLRESRGHVEAFQEALRVCYPFASPQTMAELDVLLGSPSKIVSLSERLRSLGTKPTSGTDTRARTVRRHAPAPVPRLRTNLFTRYQILTAAGLTLAFSLCGALLLWKGTHGWQNYRTQAKQMRAVALEDGSIVHLNGNSEMRVRVTAEIREVQLTSGEGFFKVAHDPSRPFLVHSGHSVIQAVGTQFNVQLGPQATQVSVIEGTVLVSQDGVSRERSALQSAPDIPIEPAVVKLQVGEGANISVGGEVSRFKDAAQGHAATWHQQQLEFHGTPLGEVVAQFNAHNLTPQFHIEGEQLVTREISGVFKSDATHSFLRVLRNMDGLTVERKGNDYLIRPGSN